MKRSLSLLVLSAAFALAACDDGSGTGPRFPAAATAASATSQSARAGDTVPAAPSVRVTDAQGNPMEGVPVQFSAGGGGILSIPQTVTASDGTASAGQWRLGAGPGLNTATALVPGLPPVTFTANGVDPCSLSTPYAIGDTVSGELNALDCPAGGGRVDLYAVEVASSGSFVMEVQSSGEPSLSLTNAEGQVIAQGGLRVHVLALPAGTYFVRVGATSGGAAASHAYTLATRVNTDATGCGPAWIVPGGSTEQEIGVGDFCLSQSSLEDQFAVHLQAGQAIAVTLQARFGDPTMSLSDPAGTWVARGGYLQGSDAQLHYVATTSGMHILRVGPLFDWVCNHQTGCRPTLGRYTLTVR